MAAPSANHAWTEGLCYYNNTMLIALFSTWEFNLPVLLTLGVFGALYVRGWLYFYRKAQAQEAMPLRPRPAHPARFPLSSPWRLAAYLSGLLFLAVALLSGLDAYSSLLFFVHMIQHLLILMVVPPLLWLADPFPIALWGLPRSVRLRMSDLLAAPSPFRRVLTQLTRPGPAWLYLVVVTWVWHDGKIYSLALESELLHDFEHLSFFLVSMVFWWHVVGSAPHIHPSLSYLKRAGFVIAAAPPNMLLGVAIAFASEPLYPYYTTVPRVFGFSVMADQVAGGVLMWIPGSMMYLMAALILIAHYLRLEEQKAPLLESHWADNDELLAPGLENHRSTSARRS